MRRGVAYIRTSTAKQEVSPDAQKERLKQYAAYSEIDLPDEWIIIDTATSGRSIFESRELGQKALSFLESADIIIFAKLARAFRNAADAMTLVPKLLKRGKDVAFLDLGINVNSPTGKMVMGMLAVQAEWEADVISERTKEALGELKRQNRVVGSVPYGFDSISRIDGAKTRRSLVPLPEEQAIIARIRMLRSEQLSFREIARLLNADSVPAKSGGTWLSEQVRRVVGRTGASRVSLNTP